MNFQPIFLQAAADGGMYNLLFFGAIIAVFYFFLIRPQNKARKEGKSFQENLQKGDDVVTASGILGRINKIDENIVTLEVGTKTYIQVTRNSISKDLSEAVFSPAEENA